MATVLRDGVWGDIALSAPEIALIDTSAFQRLRRVRQLGFTDLVFPGAHHTRFEHSLGVFHLSGVLLERLGALPECPPITERDAAAFRAAALLHDVGHYPFSHAVEELEVEQVRRHEEIARDLVTGGEIAGVLERSWDVEPDVVGALVAGPRAGDRHRGEAFDLLRACLDGSLDVDKLDYLVRDARAANVPYGVVDVQRLIGSLGVWRTPDGRVRLAVHAKGMSSLQSLVFAKHLMFATVYWHHACRAAVAMLLRALQEALTAGALHGADLEHSDDADLVRRLRDADMPETTRSLGARLQERRLFKRAVEVGIDDPAFVRLEQLWFRPARRADVEDSWAAAARCAAGDVLLDIPEPKPIAVDLPVVFDGGRVREWDQVSGLGADDLERFQRWVRKLRVFVADAALAGRVSPIVETWMRS